VLTIEDIHTRYGKVQALKGISLTVHKGEIVAVLGSNGAGKSTLINTISGLIRPDRGTIRFDGEDMSKVPPHQIVLRGIRQVPEGKGVLSRLRVHENLVIGAYCPRDKGNVKKDLEAVYQRFPRLSERKNQIAGSLSGGEQKMLAIAMALMGRPRLLMLDEPSLGLSPLMVSHLFGIISQLHQEEITILLVEQNVQKALTCAARGYIIERGEIILSDLAPNLLHNKKVREAYLGEVPVENEVRGA
jgi:branched-chain amino acid transport system ATP-binding protein